MPNFHAITAILTNTKTKVEAKTPMIINLDQVVRAMPYDKKKMKQAPILLETVDHGWIVADMTLDEFVALVKEAR